jgi:hypothetical protein
MQLKDAPMAPFRHIMFLAIAVAICGRGASAGGEPVTVEIAPLAKVVHRGDPVVILVSQRNVSAQRQDIALPVGVDAADLNYIVRIERLDGAGVSPTELGRTLALESDSPVMIDRTVATLAPGEVVTTRFDATKLADFAAPGTYRIRLTPRWTQAVDDLSTVVTVK